MKSNKGFTLVEILIVVVILGILAAIVIPQFTNASSEAKLSTLKSNLQAVRAQIQLYKIRNNDNPPSVDTFADDMAIYLERIPANPFVSDRDLANVVGAVDSGSAWELDPNGGFTAGDGGTTMEEAHADL